MSMELPMVCTCRTEGIREAEDRRLRIFRHMRLRDMGDLTEAIVLSLAFDFSCDAEVYADQWFGISFKTPLLKESIFIPCDDPGDGFAAAWEWLAERFPDRASSASLVTDAEIVGAGAPARIAERISAAIFSQCVETERAYRDHRDGTHDGPNDYPPCEDCEVLRFLMVSAGQTLGATWGGRRLEACVNAAFGIA